MNCIVKKALGFNEYQITTHPTGEKVAKLIRSYTVKPSMRPQVVPDWISNDDLFNIAIADGSLIVVSSNSNQSTVEPMQVEEKPAGFFEGSNGLSPD
jgi:hypothetical protein